MKSKKRIGTVGKAIGCIVLLVISLFPIYWLVAMSIRPTDEMKGHISLIPQSLTGEHFTQLFDAEGFGQAIINSMQTTFGSLIISLLVGICGLYHRPPPFPLRAEKAADLLGAARPRAASGCIHHPALHHVQPDRRSQHQAPGHAGLRAHQRAAHHLVPDQLFSGPAGRG